MVVAMIEAFVEWPKVMSITIIALVVSGLIIGFAIDQADQAKDAASKKEQHRQIKESRGPPILPVAEPPAPPPPQAPPVEFLKEGDIKKLK